MTQRFDERVGTLQHGPSHQSHICPSARLIGCGFRLWLRGCKTGDVSCWENAWQLYANKLGPKLAQVAIAELSSWVRTVSSTAIRDIEVLPDTCPGFCRDECLAIAMIAAGQHKVCPAMRACAFALVEHASIERVVNQSEQFAMTMTVANQILPSNYIVNVAALSATETSGYVQ